MTLPKDENFTAYWDETITWLLKNAPADVLTTIEGFRKAAVGAIRRQDKTTKVLKGWVDLMDLAAYRAKNGIDVPDSELQRMLMLTEQSRELIK